MAAPRGSGCYGGEVLSLTASSGMIIIGQGGSYRCQQSVFVINFYLVCLSVQLECTKWQHALLTRTNEQNGVSVGVCNSQSRGGQVMLRVVDRHTI